MSNIIKEIIDRSGKNLNQISREMLTSSYCSNSRKTDTLKRWYNATENIQKPHAEPIICFCKYFHLEIKEIEKVLNFFNISNTQKRNYFINKILNYKDFSLFTFKGFDTLSLSNFFKLLKKHELSIQADILDVKGAKRFYTNPDYGTHDEYYIRSIFLNKDTLGGDNATKEDISIKEITISLEKKDILPLLMSPENNQYNLYLSNSPDLISLNNYITHFNIENVLVKLKTTYNGCPIKVLNNLINNPHIPLELQLKIIESYRIVQNSYYAGKTKAIDISKSISFLEKKLFKEDNIMIQIYIFESLNYLNITQEYNITIYSIIKRFLNNKPEIAHPHILWSLIVTIQNTLIKDLPLLEYLEKMIFEYFDDELLEINENILSKYKGIFK